MATAATGRTSLPAADLAAILAVILEGPAPPPDPAVHHHRLGALYYLTGDVRAAEAECKRAVALRSTAAPYYSRLGVVQFRALTKDGEKDEIAASLAQMAFRKAIALDGDNAEYWYNLAVLFTKARRPVRARGLRLTSQVPMFPSEVLRNIEEAARAAIALDGGAAKYHNLLGCKHFRESEMGAAAAAFRAAATAPSARPLHFSNLGVACLLLQRYADAVGAFQGGLALAGDVLAGSGGGGGGGGGGDALESFNFTAMGVACCRALRFQEGVHVFERVVADARAEAGKAPLPGGSGGGGGGGVSAQMCMNLAFAYVGAEDFKRAWEVLEEGKRVVAEKRKVLGSMYAGPVNFWQLAEIVEQASNLHVTIGVHRAVARYRGVRGRVYGELFEVFWDWRTKSVKPYWIEAMVTLDAEFVL